MGQEYNMINLKKDLKFAGELYRGSTSLDAKTCYMKYVDIQIKKMPEEQRGLLKKMWEWEIE